MVYLSRIYTKTGDKGDTALGDGTRVPKDHPRVAAFGSVDELNSIIGLLLAEDGELLEAQMLRNIQNELFDIGADLCAPLPTKGQADQRLRIQASQAEQLEKEIDRLNASLQPLTSFVLPGGSIGAAWCHLARTVCRRAEREVVTLSHAEPVSPQVVIYLNRLSDLLFVLARVLNGNGSLDVLWVPGKTRESAQSPESDQSPER